MKLKDVLLITNNNKGTEYKYLSSMEDYMAILLRAFLFLIHVSLTKHQTGCSVNSRIISQFCQANHALIL